MNNFTTNNGSPLSQPFTGGVKPNITTSSSDLVLESGYNYIDFVTDLYYAFFMSGMEHTNEYVLVPNSDLQGIEVQSCIRYGLETSSLWLVPVDGTPVTYIEVKFPRVSEDLLRLYATDYVDSSNVELIEREDAVSSLMDELKKGYTDNTVAFLENLQALVVNRGEINPFGIASTVENRLLTLDEKLVPVFKISLGKAMLILSELGLRTIDVWKGAELNLFKRRSDMTEQPLRDTRVDRSLSALFFKGIILTHVNRI